MCDKPTQEELRELTRLKIEKVRKEIAQEEQAKQKSDPLCCTYDKFKVDYDPKTILNVQTQTQRAYKINKINKPNLHYSHRMMYAEIGSKRQIKEICTDLKSCTILTDEKRKQLKQSQFNFNRFSHTFLTD